MNHFFLPHLPAKDVHIMHSSPQQGDQSKDRPQSQKKTTDLFKQNTANPENPTESFSPLKTLRYEVMQLQQRTQEVQEAPKKYPDSESSLNHRNALFKFLEQAPIGQELLKKIEGMHINIAVADLPSGMPMIESPDTIILSLRFTPEGNAIRLAGAVHRLEALQDGRSAEPHIGSLPLHSTPELPGYLELIQTERIGVALAEIKLANALNKSWDHHLTQIFNEAKLNAEKAYTKEHPLWRLSRTSKENVARIGEEAGRKRIEQEFQQDRVVIPGIYQTLTYGQWDEIVWMRAHGLYNPYIHIHHYGDSITERIQQHASDPVRLSKFEITRADYVKKRIAELVTGPLEGQALNFYMVKKEAYIAALPASEQNVSTLLKVDRAARADLQEAYLSGEMKPTFGPLAGKSYPDIFGAMLTEEQRVLLQSFHEIVLTTDEIEEHNKQMSEVYQILVTGSDQGGTTCRETLAMLEAKENRLYIFSKIREVYSGASMGAPYHSAFIEADRIQGYNLETIVHEVRGHEFLARSDLSVFPYRNLYDREVKFPLMINEEMYCYILESAVAIETNMPIIHPWSKEYYEDFIEKGKQATMERLEATVSHEYEPTYSRFLEHDPALNLPDKEGYIQKKCAERAHTIGQDARIAAALGQVPTTEEAIFIQAAGLKLEELRVHQPDMPADLVEVLRNRSSIDTKTLEQVSLEQPYLSEKLLGELKRVEPDIETYRDRDNKQKLMIEAGEQALIKAYMDGTFIPLQAARQGELYDHYMAVNIREQLGDLCGKSVSQLLERRWENHQRNKTPA